MPLPRTFTELGAQEAHRDKRIITSAAREADIQLADDAMHEAHEQLAQQRHQRAVTALSTPFNPSEVLTAQLIEDIASNQCTLAAIASKANTSLAALATWMSRPDIAPQIQALENAIALKHRLTAMNTTLDSMNACSRMFIEYQHAESHLNFDSSDLKAQKTRCRIRENALEASRVLIQLNKVFAVDALCQSRAVRGAGGAQAAGAGCTTTNSAPNTPAPSYTPGMSAGFAERIPGCTPAPEPSAPKAHPDAPPYPDGPALKRDPLPPTHPAILRGVAPSTHQPHQSHGTHPSHPPVTPLAVSAGKRDQSPAPTTHPP